MSHRPICGNKNNILKPQTPETSALPSLPFPSSLRPAFRYPYTVLLVRIGLVLNEAFHDVRNGSKHKSKQCQCQQQLSHMVGAPHLTIFRPSRQPNANRWENQMSLQF